MTAVHLQSPTRRLRWSRARLVAVAKVLLVLGIAFAAWYELAPTSVGGRDSYVVTDGISMLPTIHGGGLVVVRQEPTYHVGEIAAYHNPLVHAVVLHRIIAVHDGRYTFKGDNNHYADPGSVTASAIVGAKWAYWPDGGTLFGNLRTPWVGGLILGLLGMWAMAGGRDEAGLDRSPDPLHSRRRPAARHLKT